jgi:hypothetical protein
MDLYLLYFHIKNILFSFLIFLIYHDLVVYYYLYDSIHICLYFIINFKINIIVFQLINLINML